MEADPAFFSSLLGNLPGDDPQIQEVLRNMGAQADKAKDKDSK